MGCPQTHEVPGTSEWEQWVFTFSIEGDLRFISHRDTLRMFQRAAARASLPVRYTEGFNPHPRLAIPLPRPVGMASQAESIVIEFEKPVNGDEVLHELEQQTPPDLKMIRAQRLEPRRRLQPALVRYRLELNGSVGADIESQVQRLMESTTLPVKRSSPKNPQTRIIDVRPYIVSMDPCNSAVEFVLRVTGGGTVKPAEVAGLLGFEPRAINHRIRRLEIQWE